MKRRRRPSRSFPQKPQPAAMGRPLRRHQERTPPPPVLSPPFYHPTLTWGHPTEFAPPSFQREDSTKDKIASPNYQCSAIPEYPRFVVPEHPLLIYCRSVLPWDADGTHSLDPQGPLYTSPSSLLLTEHPYGPYHTLIQTPPRHFGFHCTPKQLPCPYQETGLPHMGAHRRYPWLVYPPSNSEGDPQSVPAWAAHWGIGGDRPGSGEFIQRETDSPLHPSLGEEDLRSTNQSGDGTPHIKPIRWSDSSVSSQQEGTVPQAKRSAGGSLGHPIASFAEEEEDEYPLNLSAKDWAEEECITDLRTSRGRHPSQDSTQQNTPLNLSLRKTLSQSPESSLLQPDGEMSEARRRTAAFALCQLAASCSDRLNNTTTPSTCGETATSAQQSPRVKGQKRSRGPLQRHPKRSKTTDVHSAL
ncbi:hypothetical protein SKAU_G00295830 [Synaphobranchus kaupii]|uniref:Uncharacterized protein n=1 Tax=Synaphobranchus kaupii TaxID=118154 RepID=A0A9Q1EUP7_SYNKA|nr:hypothetical protein SKAU_G00295830 [Synaphobranchus kaupii]